MGAAILAWLAAAGGAIALAFIVLLALGIVAMAVLYVGSAVVVLERFARVARGWRSIAGFAVLVSVVTALVWADLALPELRARPWDEWFAGVAPLLLRAAVATGVMIAVCRLALSRLSSDQLGTISLVILGLSVTPVLVSALPLVYAFLPLVAVAAVALFFAWRRARSPASQGEPPPSRRLLWLGCAIALGLVTALLPDESGELLGSAGSLVVGVFFGAVIFGLLPLAAAGLLIMRGTVEWFIAVRYLVAKRRQVFISAITAICVGGIAAGVWLIVVVLSVMNGFERTWREEILGNRAHFTVHSGFGPFEGYDGILQQVRDVEGVTAASPYVDAEGMVRGDRGEIFSVRLRGIDPVSVGDVTDLRNDLLTGSIDELVPVGEGSAGEGEAPGIVIGNQLAVSAGVGPGDTLVLISPFGGPQTPLGPAPRLKRFRVVGIYQSSFFQYDEVYTYVAIPAAQDFRRVGDVVDGIEVRTTDFYRSRRVGDAVRAALDYPYYTRDWKDFFPAFFQALKTERVMMFLLLTMIMVVAAFLIVATLIMMIMEKSSDIAILKAMGAEDATIQRIFAIEGTLIGLAGTLFGVIGGIAVTAQLEWLQGRIETITGIDTLPASVYQFSTLPTQVNPVQVGFVAAIAMVLSLGATLLPSRQGARLDPAEGLRYE
jgi:lipoprotein-releasing system permease protein